MPDVNAVNTPYLLEAKNLSVYFGQGEQAVRAVDGIDFHIRKGESVALVGESGSGKSVSAQAILKLLPYPYAHHPSGEIIFDGEDLLRMSEYTIRAVRGRRIGMIFQEPMHALNPLHDVRAQIAEAVKVHQKISAAALKKRVHELMETVGLGELYTRRHCYPHQISGGQRQRVMIAAALANNPDLLLADEPTTALDVTIAAQIMQLLKDLQRTIGMAVLFITHDLGVVRDFCTRVYVMKDGKIVEQGETAALFAAPSHPYTVSLIQADNPGVRDIQPLSGEKILEVKNLHVRIPLSQGIFRFKSVYAHILKNISFSVSKGSTLGIVGESGSGKTTLARAILKLLEYEGTVSLMEQDMRVLKGKKLRAFRRFAGLVSQDPFSSLSPKMTIRGIVTEGLRIHYPELSALQIREKFNQALSEMGLDTEIHADRYPFEFSGGQRQRIAIARAIIYNPMFLILDEPTSALDKTIQIKILTLLKDIQQKLGLTYLFISHDLRVIRAVSDEVLVLQQGQIVEFGRTEDIFNNPKHPYTKRLIESVVHKSALYSFVGYHMTDFNIQIPAAKGIALVAHDNRKSDMIEWVQKHVAVLGSHTLYGTRSTATLIEEKIGLKLHKLLSGPLGGDQQIGTMIIEGRIHCLVFLWDPLSAQPHDPDVKALLRISALWNIPVACNESTADFIITSPLFSVLIRRWCRRYLRV
ncbi:hypothetical protein CHS0354_001969 [Potamilus streckersoni]|uniref:Methylglyoxal synthase n=1 Tax=Potamilus streckersoni TaxID=2493646 RepID=A0AAE0T5J0_9BIVA|nr:hypothetical protein CHS0354_001969 [Potamilus streckersoni]